MKRDTFDFNCQINMFPNKLCNYSCQVQTSPKILNYEESTTKASRGRRKCSKKGNQILCLKIIEIM